MDGDLSRLQNNRKRAGGAMTANMIFKIIIFHMDFAIDKRPKTRPRLQSGWDMISR
jgi:hypothetical protein